MIGGEGAWHVNDALVGGTAEEKATIAFRGDVGPIHEDIEEVEELTLSRHVEKYLESVARVAPYIFIGTCAYGACEICEPFRLLHRVAASEGDARSKRVGLYDLHNFVYAHLLTSVCSP